MKQPRTAGIQFRSLLLPLLILVFALTSCQTTDRIKKPTVSRTTAEDILIARQFEEERQWEPAAGMYQYLGQNSIQPERSQYYQKAALMLYKAGQFDELTDYYTNLAEDELIADDLQHKLILMSGMDFENGKTYQSLANLPELDTINDASYKAVALRIRAKGMLAIGKPLESVQLRIDTGQYLDNELDQSENQQFIWEAMDRISEHRIIAALSKPQPTALRGWLELNLIARRSNMLPEQMEPWINKWYELYPEHEAGGEFAQLLLAESQLIYINPTRITLMLPFQGKFEAVAEAIQNGFLYAYYNDPDEKPMLEVVNASLDPAQFMAQYHQVAQNGSDFIVGPLDKKLVNILALNEALDTPTLTLNYADNGESGINNLYQFGLRPEDEAEQIADYALVDGHYHAVTLTPDNKLGDRLSSAFTKRFELLGGQVVGSSRYLSKKNDYSVSIKQLLQVNSSDRRQDILQTVIGQPVEFIPRRRKDVDMVFIGGNPRQARLLKPQLKFHHAKDLPVYATSSISSSSADKDADRDLNEILFVDTPWALKQEDNIDYQNIQKLWPLDLRRYGKFFALGIDAYRLIPSLRRLMVHPEQTAEMNTGTLSVDKRGRVHRQLFLATYEKGMARKLKESADSLEQTPLN